ncbi:protein CFAP276-like isoform X1 [Haliotis asinina]|uniref:protein CFAP276-like isoform X1 n=1 Tax=Haliotis asinina TaxID=109174 RepID=UPI0035318D63
MMSLRDPYPFPKLQNDENFAGPRQTMKEPYGVPTHLAQKQDPWNRLNTKHTLSSTRREIQHYDPVAPQDSLDFVLKSEYNHHAEFLMDKNETLLQPETLGREHGRVLKNRTVVVIPEAPLMDHPISISEQTKRESIHCIKNAIESHHTQTTNKGYSRKPDGGFFCS